AAAINLLGFPYIASGSYHTPFWTTRLFPFRQLFSTGKVLYHHSETFAALRQVMTPQERVFLVSDHPGFELEPKVASLNRVPAIQDYDPQPARRYAEFFVLLHTGAPMASLSDFYFGTTLATYNWSKKPLLDLSAARYIVIDTRKARDVG